MKVKYSLQPLEKSIFLAGPTPRRHTPVPSWRPEALEILDRLGFTGTVFVPEKEDWQPHSDYDGQIGWEWEALNQATVVAFWVPRDLHSMPAFTTNVEYGLHVATGKAVLGCPVDAPKMTYLRRLGKRFNVPVFHTLEETLLDSIKRADHLYQ